MTQSGFPSDLALMRDYQSFLEEGDQVRGRILLGRGIKRWTPEHVPLGKSCTGLELFAELRLVGEIRSGTVSSPPSAPRVPFRRRSKEMVHWKTCHNDCQGGGTQKTYGGLEYRDSTSS